MKVALAQLNGVAGALVENAAALLKAASWAKEQGAELLITPHLFLSGFVSGEQSALVRHATFQEALKHTLQRIAHELPEGITAVLTLPERSASAVALVQRGALSREQPGLPAYAEVGGVRWAFVAGEAPIKELMHEARSRGVQAAALLGVAEFDPDAEDLRARQAAAADLARATGLAWIVLNGVGGQDERILQGGSSALSPAGGLQWQAPRFRELYALATWCESGWHLDKETLLDLPPTAGLAWIGDDGSREAAWVQAIALAIRDFVRKSGHERVVVGLSGGVDSALVAVLATAALGPQALAAVLMPGPYTAAMSLEDAQALAQNLGIERYVVSLEPALSTLERTLEQAMGEPRTLLTHENLQARLRAVILMAFANQRRALVLATSNKSECATGYGTLFGDLAGSFAPIKDLYKTDVYRLARWLNRQKAVIPERILQRAPSAELHPGQVDEEKLPPYDRLDALLGHLLEEGISAGEIAKRFPELACYLPEVLAMLGASEFKRRLAPVGPKLGGVSFGPVWQGPIAARWQGLWKEEAP